MTLPNRTERKATHVRQHMFGRQRASSVIIPAQPLQSAHTTTIWYGGSISLGQSDIIRQRVHALAPQYSNIGRIRIHFKLGQDLSDEWINRD